MTNISIIINKLITLLCKIFSKLFNKDGTVLPGSIVLKFNPYILTKIKYPKYVIGVTGSSGKGSTTNYIAHILKSSGLKVVWNKSGSNVLNGATTLVLNNTNFLTRRLKADVLVVELDESYIKHIFKKSTLTHLVITNITRDQSSRNGNPDIIFKKINESFDSNTHLIINADDAIVNKFSLDHQGKLTTFGIAKTKYSLNKPYSNNLDAAYCPVCSSKLIYDYYHYGHLGGYKCKSCDYKRSIDYEASQIDLDKKTIVINNNKTSLNKNIFFDAYNTLAAYTLCKEIGIKEEELLKALNINKVTSKRMRSLKLKTRDIIMLESKNENNLSYNQSLTYINQTKGNKTIILGFDNVSRRYKYNDLSWLYDVDFNILDTKNIDRIFCIGRFRFDVAARLINSGINPELLILVDNINNIISLLKENSTGNIFTMVCFDMTDILTKLLTSEEEGDHNEN
ncbi:MAG: MurT ligase domain-containing protein [Bacilli bacterium]|nr:MurT ligase domain-containing protein [Bacilli bacterium]MDD4796103.1 MurT ligase domain-containing protein [Bacilli bacterium]